MRSARACDDGVKTASVKQLLYKNLRAVERFSVHLGPNGRNTGKMC